jgi:hypothetical protein
MNDWMHTIFENDHCPSYLKRRAQNLIGAQIVLSVYGLMHFGSVKSVSEYSKIFLNFPFSLFRKQLPHSHAFSAFFSQL